MKEVMGWWLPDADTYFAKTFENQGFVGFQQERLEEAITYHKKSMSSNLIALDIGAHTGLWTRRLAEIFISVIAFEPDPETFACLQKNVGHLNNVTLVNAAVGDENCTVVMDTSYGVENTGGYFVQKKPGAEIQMITLDSYAISAKLVSFVKIDVEGAEPLVLRGGQRLFQEAKPMVFMELKKGFTSRFSEPPRAAYNELVRMGARPVARWRADHLFSWK